MDKEYSKVINELIDNQPPRVFIQKALKKLFVISSKWDCLILFLLSFISGCISYEVALKIDAVKLVSKLCEHLLEIQLAIFSCIFAVYSILLAFLSDKYMKWLAKVSSDEEVSSLTRYTTYYESVLFLYFINIAVTALLLLATDILPMDASLTINLHTNNIMACLGLFFYLLFSFRVFYEIKSTIYNTIILLRYCIAYRFVNFAKEEKDQQFEGQDS